MAGKSKKLTDILAEGREDPRDYKRVAEERALENIGTLNDMVNAALNDTGELRTSTAQIALRLFEIIVEGEFAVLAAKGGGSMPHADILADDAFRYAGAFMAKAKEAGNAGS